MDKKLKEKLKKLFALARDAGATEGEASTAMLKAQELLAIHKMTMSDVEMTDEGMATGEEIHIGKRPWVTHLYASAGRLCFCEMFVNGKQVVLIGKPSDIESAKCLAEYLTETCLKLSKGTPSGGGSRHAWKTGFAHRVAIRSIEIVRLARENKLKNSENGTDLILSPLYSQAERDNMEYLKNKGIRLARTKSRSSISNGSAYRAGAEAGNSVHLGSNVIGRGTNPSVKALN